MVQKKKLVLQNSEFPEMNKFLASSLIVNHRCGKKEYMTTKARVVSSEQIRAMNFTEEKVQPRFGVKHERQMPPKDSKSR